jgi:hypothetical protein
MSLLQHLCEVQGQNGIHNIMAISYVQTEMCIIKITHMPIPILNEVHY